MRPERIILGILIEDFGFARLFCGVAHGVLGRAAAAIASKVNAITGAICIGQGSDIIHASDLIINHFERRLTLVNAATHVGLRCRMEREISTRNIGAEQP